MESGRLHRLAREELGPLLAGLGFKRTPGTSTASWVRAERDRWLVIWLQPSRSTARSAGLEFTIEFRLSSKPETGGDGYRARLPRLLTDQGRTDDVWFQYANEAEARSLMAFFAGVLPAAVKRFLDASAAG